MVDVDEEPQRWEGLLKELLIAMESLPEIPKAVEIYAKWFFALWTLFLLLNEVVQSFRCLLVKLIC